MKTKLKYLISALLVVIAANCFAANDKPTRGVNSFLLYDYNKKGWNTLSVWQKDEVKRKIHEKIQINYTLSNKPRLEEL